MNFISSCAKIKNLAPLNLEKAICLDCPSLYIVLNGNALVTVGKKVYALKEGHILIADKREVCYIKDNGSVLGFGFECEEGIEAGISRIPNDNMLLVSTLSEQGGQVMYPLLELILCSSERLLYEHLEEGRDIELFAKAVDLMLEKIDTRASVEEFAEQLDISRSHIKRIFAALSGIGAHDYFNLLKINKAKELLLSGYSVTTTAERTGFANQAYFSAAFKRIAGISPKDFSGGLVKRRPVERTVKEIPTQRKELPSYLL